MFMLPEILFRRIEELRTITANGDRCEQSQINSILHELEPNRHLLQAEERDESLCLVDKVGRSLPVTAPRWLCHILGLRHRAVHVLIQWQSPSLGPVFLLQVRSWSKVEYPGHLDLSATGHVIDSDNKGISAAYRELKEELGLTAHELTGGTLEYVAGYQSTDYVPSRNFVNVEWRDLYIGTIPQNTIGAINFSDGEVIALYLCPRTQAQDLLDQPQIPLAHALSCSLPRILSRSMPEN